MRISSLTIEKKHVLFDYIVNAGGEAESKKTEECPEAPLPELTEAFALLPAIVCKVMGWSKDYVSGLSVYKIGMSYTKLGTRSAQFKFTKSIDTVGGELHKMITPFVRIDPPSDGESGKQELTDAEVKIVDKVIFECSRYISGERAQALLALESKTAGDGINALAGKGANELELSPV